MSTIASKPAIAEGEATKSTVNLSGDISWSVVRTELNKIASAYAAKIIPKLPVEILTGSAGWSLFAGPSIDIKTGGKDAFDSISLKAQGFYWPDTKDKFKLINLFPFSLGAETTSNFDEIATIAEVGWVPIGEVQNNTDRFGFTEGKRFGIFLQGGYLIDNGSGSTSNMNGGTTIQSEEKPNSTIARIKADLHYSWDWKWLAIKPSLIGWYDIKNNAMYYHAEALIRIKIVQNKYFFDLKYSKGSGAPNFNKGDQFGAGLAVAF